MTEKQGALTYKYAGLIDSISTLVEIFSDVYAEITSYRTNALWDTGAMGSVIAPAVVTKLNLEWTLQLQTTISKRNFHLLYRRAKTR